MAPNKKGSAPDSTPTVSPSIISKAEVEARGKGTLEDIDSYTPSLKSEKRVFFTGLMFLTRLPCPGWCDHHPAYLMRSVFWFPLIGALVGAWGGVFYLAALALWPETPLIAASVSTLSTVWLTGCFHEDGLADVFDSFGGGWGKDQILRIMKDSRIGTYALIGSSLVLQMKIQALAGLDKEMVLRALIAVHCTARWTSLPLIYCVHYIQDEEDAKKGLYNWFAQSQKLLTIPRLILGTLITACVAIGALGQDLALLLFFTTIIMTISAGYYANYVLGGVVGDYLGATICVTEAILYMVMLVDWRGVVETPERWQALVSVAVVAALPIIYSRRVIHYKGSC